MATRRKAPAPNAAVPVGDPARPLTVEDVVAVAREFAPVSIAPSAARRVVLSREVVRVLVEKQVKVYGLTTGFASLREIRLDAADAGRLSGHLIRSHAAGVGKPFPEDVVRAAMLLRAATLLNGNSGVRLELVRRLVAMLNARVYPFVPEQGSLGSSGDLAPLSHVFLALMGDPNGRVHGRVLAEPSADAAEGPSADAATLGLDFVSTQSARKTASSRAAYVADPSGESFVRFGATDSTEAPPARARFAAALRRALPLDGLPGADPAITAAEFPLVHKEGLAGNNGAVFTAAIAALCCFDAERLLRSADLVAALSFEALQAVADCLDERVVAMRPHPGHGKSAKNLRDALAGSSLVRAGAPFALNMARYNRAVVAVTAALESVRGAAAKEADDLVSAIESLRAAMHAQQRQLADVERKARAAPRRAMPAKAAEVAARREAFASLDRQWEQLLERPAARRLLQKAHHEHVRIVRPDGDPEVQDNYSFRAAATIAGTGWEALDRARRTVEIEMASTTDNPLIGLDSILAALGFVGRVPTPEALHTALERDDRWTLAADAILSAANFHGEPVGAVCDHLAAAIAEVGNVAERRVAVLTDQNHSKGLPSALTWKPGLNSGLMMSQYAAASLVMENRHLAMPASTDSVPTGENTEDLVAMSTYAARKCAAVIANAERIVGIELLCAYQGVQFRRPCRLGARTGALEAMLADRLGGLLLELGEFEGLTRAAKEEAFRRAARALGLGESAVSTLSPCVLDDVVLYPAMEACAALMRRGDVAMFGGPPSVPPRADARS